MGIYKNQVMRQKTAAFDSLVSSYTKTTDPLPEAYIALIKSRLCLGNQSIVLDLGCGSGSLTIALSESCALVKGVDSSIEMIRLARKRERRGRVLWFNQRVEDFDFGGSEYDLIIGFESFHHFLSPEVIEKCGMALREDGFLAVGWLEYCWEAPLKELVLETFRSQGINWGDWDYYKCPDFPRIVGQTRCFSSVNQESITVHRTYDVGQIARYLVSIGKVAALSSRNRKLLAQKLESKIKAHLPSESISGFTTYALQYCRKITIPNS